MLSEIFLINQYLFTLIIILLIIGSVMLKMMQIKLLRIEKIQVFFIIIGLGCLFSALLLPTGLIFYIEAFYILILIGTFILTLFFNNFLRKLVQLATFDPLTGIYNKNNLYLLLERSLKNARRTKRPMSILFMDIDNFKCVNDELGHEVGDFILCQLVKEMNKNIRKKDLLIRYGGDEFILILPDTNRKIAEQIEDRLENAIYQLKIDYNISLSSGISSFPDDAEIIEELIELADNRMYQNKQFLKNQTPIPNSNSLVVM